jgi:hypothetical protein
VFVYLRNVRYVGCWKIPEVVCHLACRACSSFADISGHCSVEGIASDDVMEMSGWFRAGLYDGVESLDCEC